MKDAFTGWISVLVTQYSLLWASTWRPVTCEYSWTDVKENHAFDILTSSYMI